MQVASNVNTWEMLSFEAGVVQHGATEWRHCSIIYSGFSDGVVTVPVCTADKSGLMLASYLMHLSELNADLAPEFVLMNTVLI